MTKLCSAFFALCVAVLTPGSVTAQDFYLPPIIDNVGMGNIAIGAAADAHVRQSRQRSTRRNQGEVANNLMAAPTRDASGANLDFSYRYDKARTRQNLQNFVARTPNAGGRAELQKLIAAQPDIIRDIRAGIQPYGLDSHNVADAYAFYWINAWLVANKRDEDPDRGTIAMVKQQVRNAFAATPSFFATSSADRQEYAESLMLQATILASSFEQLQNNPAMLDQLAKAARQGAKASGLNLSLMTLTKNGFVPRTGAQASDAIRAMDRVSSPDDARLALEEAAPPAAGSSDVDGVVLAAIGLGTLILGGIALRRGA